LAESNLAETTAKIQNEDGATRRAIDDKIHGRELVAETEAKGEMVMRRPCVLAATTVLFLRWSGVFDSRPRLAGASMSTLRKLHGNKF